MNKEDIERIINESIRMFKTRKDNILHKDIILKDISYIINDKKTSIIIRLNTFGSIEEDDIIYIDIDNLLFKKDKSYKSFTNYAGKIYNSILLNLKKYNKFNYNH